MDPSYEHLGHRHWIGSTRLIELHPWPNPSLSLIYMCVCIVKIYK